MHYEENPAVAHWDALAKNRELVPKSTVILEDVHLLSPRVGRHKDTRTGKVTEELTGGPKIKAPHLTYLSVKGRTLSSRNHSLFTWTSKMSCASFSIPAGPTKFGGSCAAALPKSIESEGSYTEFHPPLEEMPQKEVFICDVCYAGKGRYLMYPGMSVGQMVRYRWVEATLKAGSFVHQMTGALKYLLGKNAKGISIEEVLARKLVSNKFFRIHDSGDFYSKDYYKAWIQICENLQEDGVQFWAPTRLWVYESWRKIFNDYPPPENLSLRPSALFTSAPPPMIDGLAAGSTSVEGSMEDKGVKDCPAYDDERDEHSCAAAHCRTCWDDPETPVNYLTH